MRADSPAGQAVVLTARLLALAADLLDGWAREHADGRPCPYCRTVGADTPEPAGRRRHGELSCWIRDRFLRLPAIAG